MKIPAPISLREIGMLKLGSQFLNFFVHAQKLVFGQKFKSFENVIQTRCAEKWTFQNFFWERTLLGPKFETLFKHRHKTKTRVLTEKGFSYNFSILLLIIIFIYKNKYMQYQRFREVKIEAMPEFDLMGFWGNFGNFHMGRFEFLVRQFPVSHQIQNAPEWPRVCPLANFCRSTSFFRFEQLFGCHII